VGGLLVFRIRDPTDFGFACYEGSSLAAIGGGFRKEAHGLLKFEPTRLR